MRKTTTLFLYLAICTSPLQAIKEDLRSSSERLLSLESKKAQVAEKLREAQKKRDDAASASSSPTGSPRDWQSCDEESLGEFIKHDRLLRGCQCAMALLNTQIERQKQLIAKIRAQDSGEAPYNAFDYEYESCVEGDDLDES